MAPAPPCHVAIIGGGPAGLMAAEVIARAGMAATIYDRMPAPGRKFLLAGRGGLNLTHSEDLETLLHRYGAAEPKLSAAIKAFPPASLRAWCEELGQPTFTGSSGRVFPEAMKSSPLLRAWLRRLDAAGVVFKLRHRWEGWDDSGRLIFYLPRSDKHRGEFATTGEPLVVAADATILALGGASWPRLGSDGAWTAPLAEAGIAIAPLRPANCGFIAGWSEVFRDRFQGQPLKGVGLAFENTQVFGGRDQTSIAAQLLVGRDQASIAAQVLVDRDQTSIAQVRGEALITRDGLQGSGIYALSALLRDAIAATGEAILHIDLRPGISADDLAKHLDKPRGKQSLATFLRKAAKLSPVEIGLLQEAALALPGRLAAMTPAALAMLIKAVPIRLTATAPIARAISTAGGIALGELDEHFMLRHMPGTFAAGEMLDWEAPTGGYLLQACFATGAAAGRGAVEWLRHRT